MDRYSFRRGLVTGEANDRWLRLFNYKSFIQTNNVEFDTVSLKRINRLDFFDGTWQANSPDAAAEFSAIAFHFGRELRERLNVPVGLIQVAVGGAPIESFIDRRTLEFSPVLVDQFLNREKNDFIFEWVRGRWYQGESNAHNADLYKIAFHDWVNSWRKSWNNPKMTVLVAQLSGIDRP